MAKEFIIYADESEQRGAYFSHFYGGALVLSADIENVVQILEQAKQKENLHKEIKWVKVTENYLAKYQNVIHVFFDLIREKKIRVRIMFSDNQNVPVGLTTEQKENGYFLLYYQFLKHAFGLRFANAGTIPIRCRLLLDELPDTQEKVENFKTFIANLSLNKDFRGKIYIDKQQIHQVHSHEHVILQCLDVVLGAMAFRLNRKHELKPDGQQIRGKRTIAKEKLYKFILKEIKTMRPNFNIGITSGKESGMQSIWDDPYRHWSFVPQNFQRESRKRRE